jgi:hypothetical protein
MRIIVWLVRKFKQEIKKQENKRVAIEVQKERKDTIKECKRTFKYELDDVVFEYEEKLKLLNSIIKFNEHRVSILEKENREAKRMRRIYKSKLLKMHVYSEKFGQLFQEELNRSGALFSEFKENVNLVYALYKEDKELLE